jgi:cysteine desulfurase/selenocysteine lyase
MNERGELDLDALRDMLAGGKVRMISVVHLSNSLGTINDVKTIAKLAHEKGALVMVDGAQWAGPLPDQRAGSGVDFYAFSGHKLYGPPASACCGESASCWKRCRRTRAAGT